jgi:hypothetical protein
MHLQIISTTDSTLDKSHVEISPVLIMVLLIYQQVGTL